MGRWPFASIVPQPSKPIGRELAIAHCVLDRAVTEIMLQGARVGARIGQLVADRMTQLVRMDEPREACRLADPRQGLAEAGSGHRGAALILEHETALRPLAPQLAQRP